MEKLETNIITPERDTGKDADIIEDLEIMAQSMQAELNKKADNSITEEFNEKLNNKVDKQQGKDLSTNDFTNILKEKLENLENYNDKEIRNILNSSLKEVNYTASNGMLTFTKNDGSKIDVDLPLELLVESGRYDEQTKQIVLTLANRNVINIPVSDLLDDFYGKSETYNKTEVDNLIAEKQRQIEALENEIDDLIEENLAQQEEIDMLTADYRENTIEGETVAVSDGLPKSKASSIINGNSYQYTTEGYNLCDLSNYGTQTKGGVTVSQNADGSFNATGTGSINYITFKSGQDITDKLEDGEKYTLWTNKHSSLMLVQVAARRVDGGSTSFHTTEYVDKRVFTVDKSVYSTYILNFQSGATSSGATYNLENMQFMLLKGDYSSTEVPPYEPYTNGASPNTEYEQDIEVITECSLVQRGKNYVNIADYTKTSMGITSSNVGKNKIKISGTTTGNWCDLCDYIKTFLEKGSYTISSKNAIGTIYLAIIDEDGNENLYNKIDNNKKTITFSKNIVKFRFYLSDLTAETKIDERIIEFQLEKGEVATEIEPHIEPIVHEIDLQGNSIAKVGEIADLLNIGVDGSVKLTNNISMYEFTGNEDWRVSSDNAHYIENVHKTLGYHIKNELVLCNVLKSSTINETRIGTNKISTQLISNNQSRIWVSPNVDVIKLIGNYVYLARVTPQTIPLPSIGSIKLFEGTNVFELVTNLGTTLSVTYKVSNKSRLESLENAILSLGGNI